MLHAPLLASQNKPAKTMTMKPANSSNVDSYGYDADTKVLAVKFKSGKTYRYANVPADKVQALEAAPSIGRFVGGSIVGKFAEIKGD